MMQVLVFDKNKPAPSYLKKEIKREKRQIKRDESQMTFLFSLTFFCQLFIAGLSMYLVIIALISLLILSISCYYFFDHVNKRVHTWIQQFFDPDPFSQITSSLNCFKSGTEIFENLKFFMRTNVFFNKRTKKSFIEPNNFFDKRAKK